MPNYPPELDPTVARPSDRARPEVLLALAARIGVDVYDPVVAAEQSGLPSQPRAGSVTPSAQRKDEPGALSDIGEW